MHNPTSGTTGLRCPCLFFFFLPPPAACVCIKRGNKRKKKNGNLNPANAPPHKHPHNARHTHAPLSCVLSYPGTIASHAACENVAQRCARCPVAGPPVSTAFSCRATQLAWGAAPSERRNTSPAPARTRPPPPAVLMGIYWNIFGRRRGRTDVRMCTSGTPYLCYYFARQYPPAQCLRSTFTQGPALYCSVPPPRSAPWVSPGEMLMQEVVP